MKILYGRVEHIELPDGTTLEVDCSWPDVWIVSRLDPDNNIPEGESFTIDAFND